MTDRKVVLKMVMSLDGFVTSPDGTHRWMFEWFGDDSGDWNRRALDAAGVHAMGRRSYEIMGPHWAASEGPIATAMNEKATGGFLRTLGTGGGGAHARGRRSYEIMGPHWAASEGPIATAMNEKPKAVFSRTLEKVEWGPAEIFGGDLAAALAELKARDDRGTILVHGGPGFARSL